MSEVAGWMDCAIQTARGGYMSGIIVDHDDASVLLYIDRDKLFQASNDALACASRSRSTEDYKRWSHSYAIVGKNLNA